MRAITFRRAGTPDVLCIECVPNPVPSPDDIIVRNVYSGINFGDTIRRSRGVPELATGMPYVPGFEGCGEVVEVGRNARFNIGDQVAYLVTCGACAELTSVPAGNAVHIPTGVEPQLVAASMCTGTTAWHLLRLAELSPGNAVLVHGGGGGVGSALLQFARGTGCSLFATAGSADKAEQATQAGADVVIRHDQEEFSERVLRDTAGKGVTVVFDGIGQAAVEANAKCLAPHGRWLYYGSTSGHAAFPGLPILTKSLRVQGFVIFDVLGRPSDWREGAAAVVTALQTQVLSPQVSVFDARGIQEAHRRLESRTLIGRAVLDVSSFMSAIV